MRGHELPASGRVEHLIAIEPVSLMKAHCLKQTAVAARRFGSPRISHRFTGLVATHPAGAPWLPSQY